METTELIKNLSTKPIEANYKLLDPMRESLVFLIVSSVIIFFTSIIFSLDLSNISQQNWEGIIEIGAIFIFIFSSIYYSLKSSIPGRLGRGEKYFPLLALIFWTIILVMFHKNSVSLVIDEPEPEFECTFFLLKSGIIFSLIPTLILKRTACTTPTYTGINLLFASLGVGLLILKIACPRDGLTHQFLWHLLPFIIVSFVMVPVWRRVFRIR